MSKMFKVFVKDDAGKWEERQYVGVCFMPNGEIDVLVVGEYGNYQPPAALFRDLDLSKPIPPDVKCVVCHEAFDEVYEGDIITDCMRAPNLTVVWCVGDCRYILATHDNERWDSLTATDCTHTSQRGQHHLTHHIIDGEVKER